MNHQPDVKLRYLPISALLALVVAYLPAQLSTTLGDVVFALALLVIWIAFSTEAP